MQPTSTLVSQTNQHRGGGRIASPAFRQSLDQCEDFAGLEENTNRYDLLLLAKRTGKLAGFSPRMIYLLDYYMAFTCELDWEEGSRPIVYQSLARTSLDLGVTERQIQKLEKQLFEVGAITWNDSGNHKRYGKRDPETRRIQYAYGIDLTPLAYLKPALEEKLYEKQLYDKAWLDTKREISQCRRQIRSLILELQEQGSHADTIHSFENSYTEIAIQLRTNIRLEALRPLLARHSDLHSSLLKYVAANTPAQTNPSQASNSPIKTPSSSCTSEPEFAHYKYTNPFNKNTCSLSGTGFQESVAEPSERNKFLLATGLQHISLKHVLLAASERYRAYLPVEPRPMNWNDAVEAAYRLRIDLRISQQSWADACELLGRAGASICVLLTDQAIDRTENRVRQPAAYFRGMVNRARAGELRLHNSIFGLLAHAEPGSSSVNEPSKQQTEAQKPSISSIQYCLFNPNSDTI